MPKNRATITPAGLNRDLPKSKFQTDMAYDARNIRISARDKATTIASITNERGPLRLNEVIGNPVGVFVADSFLGVFSFDNTSDHIVVYQKKNDEYSLFYHWKGIGLGFSELWDSERGRAIREIETEVSTEASNSVRVYWVDGKHSPRVIDFKRRASIVGNSVDTIESDYFLFIPAIKKISNTTITKRQNGYFFSGTTQICITEVINANESNIVYYSPLHYCTPPGINRATSPDNVADGCSFKVEWRCEHPELIDYFNVYAIYRSSEDGTAVVFKDEVRAYQDSHVYSTIIVGNEEVEDSAYLTFKNSAQLSRVATITQQDGTLFLGNLEYEKETENNREVTINVTTILDREISDGSFHTASGYVHSTQLDKTSFEIGHFKHREKYALGYQFMDKYGHWSEPFYSKSLFVMDKAPSSDGNKMTIPSFKASIKDIPDGVIAIRPVVSYLDDSQKRCLYQGILTPTIFCEKERAEGICYAKFSPFARSMKHYEEYRPDAEQINPNFVVSKDHTIASILPSTVTAKANKFSTNPIFDKNRNDVVIDSLGYSTAYKGDDNYDSTQGTRPANMHLQALGTCKDYNGEFQSSWYTTDVVFKSELIPFKDSTALTEDDSEDIGDYVAPYDTDGSSAKGDLYTLDNTKYYVDTSVLSFHSPDIQDWTDVSKDNGRIQITGAVAMNGFVSDTSIVASTPKLASTKKFQGNPGFNHIQLKGENTGSRCAMTIPSWQSCWHVNDASVDHTHAWAVNPFSNDYIAIFNDFASDSEKKESKVEYKQLSNFRYCDKTLYYDNDNEAIIKNAVIKSCIDRSDIQKYDTDNKIYKPAEDTVLSPNSRYAWTNGFYYSDNNTSYSNYIKGQRENMQLERVNKLFIEDRNNLLGCYSCIEYSNKVVDIFKFNFVPLSSIMCRGYYGKNEHPSYRGFWKSIVKDLGFNWSSRAAIQKNAQEWYTDILYHKNKSTSNHVALQDGSSDYGNDGSFDRDDVPMSVNVGLKYLSSPHMMIALNDPIENTNYLSDYIGKIDADRIDPVSWNKSNVTINKYNKIVESGKELPENYSGDALWLADVINNDGEADFEARTAQWLIAGDSVDVVDGKADIRWVQGDWFFQRWECLRTHAETTEDKNQVVEIVSFCVETRQNIDGRYDRNRGTAKLTANPSNWNLINTSFSQKNNFFTYSVRSENDNVVTDFPVSVTWSLSKVLNSNVDKWTNITGVSMLDFDGDKGPITRLVRNRNLLFCFQPKGISRLLYNSRTQLATTEGLPIEVLNSGKVEGKQYISNSSGAVNNYNISSTDNAIYYVDAFNKCISVLNESRGQLSETLGLHSWVFSLEKPDKLWSMIDAHNTSILFVDKDALSFNEKHTCFESFYDYDRTSCIANVEDDTILFHKDDSSSNGKYYLWRMNAGEWNKFFGVDKSYMIDCLISGDRQTDKIFNNVEYHGDLLKGEEIGDELAIKKSPFNTIQAYHEYQDTGEVDLEYKQFRISNIKNMFRTWDSFIPRNKIRKIGKIAERIRNPWAHIKMIFDPNKEKDENKNLQAIIQDINVDYFE